MNTYPSRQKIHTKIQVLAIYQILGGIIGLYLTLKYMSTLSQFPDLLILLFFLGISLYCYSLVCGILILARKDRNLKYSVVNQYLQLINFATLGYSFMYTTGIYLLVGVDFTDIFKFTFNVGLSTWRITFNTDDGSMEVNLNLVALFVIIFINKIQMKLNEETVNNTVEEINSN